MACTFPVDSFLHVMQINGMKLDQYMSENQLTDVALASRLGVASTTVMRWRKRETKPDWGVLPVLAAETGGAVTANDFLDAPAISDGEA